jgi:hypothetical protein
MLIFGESYLWRVIKNTSSISIKPDHTKGSNKRYQKKTYQRGKVNEKERSSRFSRSMGYHDYKRAA